MTQRTEDNISVAILVLVAIAIVAILFMSGAAIGESGAHSQAIDRGYGHVDAHGGFHWNKPAPEKDEAR